MQGKLIERYLLLFAPWILSEMLSYIPGVSFTIAWLGSFYIFYLAYSGKIKDLPSDLPVSEQLMRPIFLVHVIFAGYMSVSPIFNFLDATGLLSLDDNHFPVFSSQLELIAQSQRYYCLAHGSYVAGLLIFLGQKNQLYRLVISDLPSFLVSFTIIAIVASNAFFILPALKQFYFQLSALSFIGATMALIYSFRSGRLEYIIICSILFTLNFIQALFSGFKEPIIINILVLGVFLYPFYKKLVFITFIPIMLALLFLLPTYNQVFREKAWANEEDVEIATDAALSAVTAEDDGKQIAAWSFLTGRLSEVQMFTSYLETTPSLNDFYGFKIVSQALEVVVPRVFWPDKPITEELVMERVYQSGVIKRGSKVSAKPALVVDGYLSGAGLGVFLTCLIFGAATQLISMKAEQLFGGYLIGTALIFSGLFQILWRGLSLEFLINSVFWSYITMLGIFYILRVFNIVQKINEPHTD